MREYEYNLKVKMPWLICYPSQKTAKHSSANFIEFLINHTILKLYWLSPQMQGGHMPDSKCETEIKTACQYN